MKNLVGILIVLVAALLGSVAVTWWALESGGVAIVETTSGGGSIRSTHVWYAEPDAEIWIEAGTPENGWYVDIQEIPTISFAAHARSGIYLAEPIPGAAAHERIRALLREKYGFRDWWIATLFDTSSSIAVRLIPSESG